MATTQLYDTGDQAGLEITFLNAAGAPTDPTGVTFFLTPPPGGTALAYAYGVDAQLVRLSVGRYAVEYVIPAPGVYDYGFVGTGLINQREEAQFFVRDRLVAVSLARGYTTPAMVGRYVGRTFDGAQAIALEDVIRGVETWIDRKLGRSWNGASPTVETHVIMGARIRLNNYPITAITSVESYWTPLAVPTVLVADTQYKLVDPATGEVHVPLQDGYTARVTYTHGGPVVPADVQLAATMIAAKWIQPGVSGYDGSVRSYSVGGEISVTFATAADGSPLSVPPEACALLDGVPHRRFA